VAKYTFLDLAEDVLKNAENPMIFQDIWDQGKDEPFVRKLTVRGKTPWATIGARLFVDVRDNPQSRFVKVGRNPARFFLKSRQAELPSDIAQSLERLETNAKKDMAGFSERELHPLVSYFAYTNPNFNKGKAIYTKTIFHEKSKKAGFNEWVHPDIVGFYIPIEDWNNKLLELNTISDSNSIRLFSFELKKRIDRSNYREYFFQAVSNSSWANEGYLVAADIRQDNDLLDELERLSTAFGIGIVQLDLSDIDASKVLYPARARTELDWNLMNKLCDQNPDFEKFVDDITKDYKVRTIHGEQFEKVLEDPDEYIEKITKK
jgi:hypothetical protein